MIVSMVEKRPTGGNARPVLEIPTVETPGRASLQNRADQRIPTKPCGKTPDRWKHRPDIQMANDYYNIVFTTI